MRCWEHSGSLYRLKEENLTTRDNIFSFAFQNQVKDEENTALESNRDVSPT